MNPFELTAAPFLALYATLYVLAAAWAWHHRRGPAVLSDAPQSLSPIELAWLADGPGRAADTAVVALIAAGAAELRPSDRMIVPTEAELPAALAPFRRCLPAPARATATALVPALERVRDNLEQRGLIFSAADARRLALRSLLPFALLILFALVRIDLGVERGRPVGILVLFLTVVVLHTLILAVSRPRRSRAGTAALRDSRARHARLMRAPEDSELTLAFAIAGAVVLAGTPFEAYADWRGLRTTSAGDSGGGDSSSSSSGGGDSGGSDGGGSGCGGCSS